MSENGPSGSNDKPPVSSASMLRGSCSGLASIAAANSSASCISLGPVSGVVGESGVVGASGAAAASGDVGASGNTGVSGV